MSFECCRCEKDFIYKVEDYVLYSDGDMDFLGQWYGSICPFCLTEEHGVKCEIISREKAEELTQIEYIIYDLYCFRRREGIE